MSINTILTELWIFKYVYINHDYWKKYVDVSTRNLRTRLYAFDRPIVIRVAIHRQFAFIFRIVVANVKLQHKSKIQIPLVFTKIELNLPRWRVNSHIGHIGTYNTCVRHARWSSWNTHTHTYIYIPAISSGKLNSPHYSSVI